MNTYTIVPTDQAVPLCGDVDGTPWSQANTLEIDLFPWYESGDKQATTVRMLYDMQSLYIQFICEDKHIDAVLRELNGGVCNDSCVEFFAMPNIQDNDRYFNFEANCCRQLHLGCGQGRHGRELIDAELAKGVRVMTPFDSPTKQVSPDDNGWWLAAEIPYSVLCTFMGLEISPKAGQEWRANFYRCGGSVDDQYACWNPIGSPHPDFHLPAYFGKLIFG